MRTAGQKCCASLCAVAAICLSATALGQASSANGIKVGDGRVHPYFDLDLGMDSAAGFFPVAGGGTVLGSEAITHFRPGLKLELPSQTVAVNFDGNVEYVYYMGLLSAGSQALSHFESAVDFDANFNPAGQISFDLGDHLSRSDRTSNAALGVGVLSFANTLRAAVPIRPGGGALEVSPKGAWSMEIFQPWSTLAVPGCGTDPSCSTNALAGMAYNNLRAELDARWRFLPKTAVVFDSSFDTRSYADPSSNKSPLLLHATVGLSGLVSPKISAVVKAGWAQDFGVVKAKTVIGHLEVAYLMSDTSNLRAGYLRTLEPVPTYGINGDDRGYAEGRFLFGGKLTARGYVAYDFLTFYSPSRLDQNVTADLGADYQFTPWLIGSLGYTFGYRQSSTSAQSVNFVRNQGYLRFEFTY